jgi:hypothetical protein
LFLDLGFDQVKGEEHMSPFVIALWGITCAAGGYACGYLVGRMDKLEAKRGSAMDDAEVAKNELRRMLATPPTAQREWVGLTDAQKLDLVTADFVQQYTHQQPKRERVVFPTMLRKMWSGGEVQDWLDENVNKEKNQ